MIVTIDGPAGSGKSTAARKLAARLEIAYLDTGAMYRAIAYEATRLGVALNDQRAVLDAARSIRLDLDCGPTHTRVHVNGHDVSEAIRTMAVSAATPFVATNSGVRELLVERQRTLGRSLGSFVSEGRDQGSVVFPDADVKIVFEGSIETRAHRRYQELIADGEDVKIAEVLDDLRARDAVDARQWEPLLASGAATVLDTSSLSISQVIERLGEIVQRVTEGRGGAG